MSPEQLALWKQADDIFASLLQTQLKPGREAVEQLGLSNELQACVLALLDGFYADGPVDGRADDLIKAVQSDSQSGRNIGGWILNEPIGSGGMATVYRAYRATEDFKQVAAVKLLSGGQLSTEGAARFEQEKQILASLRHPNIAALLDAGFAADGTPFIAMEHVDGERIDQYVENHLSNVKDRIRLFLRVCQAVAFAQQKLVVHRDLKPSNILVDAHRQPKLLDFGIARLLSGDHESTTTRAFTPGYAAPEQLTGEPVTTATDVFGLGAVLYKLLTGNDAFGRGSKTEIVVPPKPSTVNASVDSDLDNVALRAIRSEPERRYAGAQQFADDLKAWLENRPVAATGDSRHYRLRRFIARNRTAVVGALIASAVGAGGLVTTLWQAQKARQQAAESMALSDFMLDLLSQAQLHQRGSDLKVTELLDSAVEQANTKLANQPGVRGRLLLTIGEAQRQLGRYEAAVQTLTSVVNNTSDTITNAQVKIALGAALYDQSDSVDEGLPWVEQGFEALSELLEPSDSRVQDAAVTLSTYWSLANETDKAERLVDRLLPHTSQHTEQARVRHLSLLRARATAWDVAGEPTRAEQSLLEIVDAYRSMSDRWKIEMAHVLNELAFSQIGLAKFDLAVATLQEAVEIFAAELGDNEANTIAALNNLAFALDRMGEQEQAVVVARRTMAAKRATYGADSVAFADGQVMLAAMLDDVVERRQLLESALDIQIRHNRINPNSLRSYALVLAEDDDLPMALRTIQEAQAIYASEEDAYLPFRMSLARLTQADLLWRLNRLEESHAAIQGVANELAATPVAASAAHQAHMVHAAVAFATGRVEEGRQQLKMIDADQLPDRYVEDLQRLQATHDVQLSR